MQHVIKRNIKNVSGGVSKIDIHYDILPYQIQYNRKQPIVPDAINVIQDLSNFSEEDFCGLNHSNGYQPKVKKRSTSPDQVREIDHFQEVGFGSWWEGIKILWHIFLRSVFKY